MPIFVQQTFTDGPTGGSWSKLHSMGQVAYLRVLAVFPVLHCRYCDIYIINIYCQYCCTRYQVSYCEYVLAVLKILSNTRSISGCDAADTAGSRSNFGGYRQQYFFCSVIQIRLVLAVYRLLVLPILRVHAVLGLRGTPNRSRSMKLTVSICATFLQADADASSYSCCRQATEYPSVSVVPVVAFTPAAVFFLSTTYDIIHLVPGTRYQV